MPVFITVQRKMDLLFTVMIVIMVLTLLLVGTPYLRRHALPQYPAYFASEANLQVIGALAVVVLFTDNHPFWIAALLLALVKFPDVPSPVRLIVRSLARVNRRNERAQRHGAAWRSGAEGVLAFTGCAPIGEAPAGRGPMGAGRNCPGVRQRQNRAATSRRRSSQGRTVAISSKPPLETKPAQKAAFAHAPVEWRKLS
ncbi:hypothetical protein BMJ29_18605 [Sinorhizobium medicae]|uniref:Transmembrane protein n=1 Tax=Sinorhizobium medicae TaxID=110321 RepID=A0ABX4TQF6_9HYPH|nr:hypothetical protein BMJ33_06620 [Sinorhizobium medicae]PLU18250.1 hypothetical protein BMJ29_18605 [Sinorhizobium medicae]PLU24501.1 hypothetical protein BMJ30_00950 [Sinorhizobium medicae]PLU40255.1 hypothetical protein BMJ27_01880 [Sinorhizobium medicae]PLU75150.1 hypothetical protein BMJ19_35000 [Sinorhizobium medicae]